MRGLRMSPISKPSFHFREIDAEFVCFSGIQMSRVLSAELFLELNGQSGHHGHEHVYSLCAARWTDFAASLASLPEETEFLLTIMSPGRRDGSIPGVAVDFVPMGRALGRKKTGYDTESRFADVQ